MWPEGFALIIYESQRGPYSLAFWPGHSCNLSEPFFLGDSGN